MNKLKSAIAGCGSIAPLHANSVENLVAVCDPDSAKTAKYPACKAYASYEDMINAGGFDVLHICLPHYLHAPAAIYALRHKIHVLCEKPMAISVQECEDMNAAATENGVTLGVIFQNRYNAGSLLVKQNITSGKLGAVKSGWLKVTWFRDENYYTQSGWRGKWQTEGGGVLINQSIHTFDLMNYFLANKLKYVNAAIFNRAHPAIEVEDVAEGVICYENDVKISFYANTYHPYDSPIVLELICENGIVNITGDTTTITYNDGTKETVQPETDTTLPKGAKSYWGISHSKQIAAFYAELAANKKPEISGAEALKTQKLICGIYESAKTGKRFDF